MGNILLIKLRKYNTYDYSILVEYLAHFQIRNWSGTPELNSNLSKNRIPKKERGFINKVNEKHKG